MSAAATRKAKPEASVQLVALTLEDSNDLTKAAIEPPFSLPSKDLTKMLL